MVIWGENMDHRHKEKRQQFYEGIQDFWPDLCNQEYALYDIKVEPKAQIDKIRLATGRIGHIFFKTARLMRHLDDETLLRLGFQKEMLSYIRLQTIAMETVVSRMEFAVNKRSVKLLTLHANTPLLIKESFSVNGDVCSHFNVLNPNEGLEEDLQKALRSAISYTKGYVGKARNANIVFTSYEKSLEDYLTTQYLMKVANTEAQYLPFSDLRLIEQSLSGNKEVLFKAGLYDPKGDYVDILLQRNQFSTSTSSVGKMEHMVMNFVENGVLGIINPPSAFLLQSNAVQALIWGLHEETHPYFTKKEHTWIARYFVPTYMEEDYFKKNNVKYVAKDLFSRESGAGQIGAKDGEGWIGKEIKKQCVYQKQVDLPSHEVKTTEGLKAVDVLYSCFLVNGKPSAVSILAKKEPGDHCDYYLPIGVEHPVEENKAE